MPSTEFKPYPKWLKHPNYRPAVVSNSRDPKTAVQGAAEQFPPVMVNNAEHEEYYKAQGCVEAGFSDPAGYLKAQAGTNHDYTPIEYPKWVNGVLVKNRDEEKA